ncbi:pirin family protein [Gorillibacterium sp. sgz5001074]|uniref:pirin family protein n=1 Tax=Gorillibacterium sp. sgz5001074 TaxID=3446695 RepID=UPI003F680105
MIRIIPSSDRFTADHGWLRSRFSFSFAEYRDPANMSFGHLRVFNDDIVQPAGGFGTHPHRDMEIVTYVIEGALEHQDSMGNKGIIRKGEIQRMTAGTGILHSEYNASDKEPVHFLQIWIMPRARNLTPSWEQKPVEVLNRPNQWTPLISGGDLPDTLEIHQDARFLATVLEPGHVLDYGIAAGNKVHLFLIDGTVKLNGEHTLKAGDAARITDITQLQVAASEHAHLLLIDMTDA